MADESVIHIRIDPSGAVTGGRVVVNTIDRIDRTADKAVGSVDLLSSALFSLGLGLGIREINNYADAWVRTTNRIRLHTDSLETLTAIQEELYQSSQRVSVSYETSVALFDKLSSSGKRLGLSFRDVLDITELVNKTISISGASTEAASRAIFQLGQALSIGTLYAEEFNSILENLPRLANVIADGTGKTVGEIKRAGPEAKVTAEQIIKAIKDQADEINRDFSNAQANIGSSFQRLQNSTLQFVGKLDEASGITSLFAEAITSLSNSLDTMREKGSPILTELFKPYTEQLKQLIKDHPEVTTNILLFTGALVGLASTGRIVS